MNRHRDGRLLPSEQHVLDALKAGPTHGYRLGVPESGGTYRLLRRLEARGLVSSEWQTQPSGPARRIYRVVEHE